MLDLRKIKALPFKVTFEDGKVLNLNQPKLKVLNKIFELYSSVEDSEAGSNDVNSFAFSTYAEVCEVTRLILENNKEKRKIDISFVYNNFDMEQMKILIEEFFKWIGTTSNNPN